MPICTQLLMAARTPMMLLLAVAASVLATVAGDDFEVNNHAGNALCTDAYAAGEEEVKEKTKKANKGPWTTKRLVTAGWHRLKDLTNKKDFGQVDYFRTGKPVKFLVTFTLENCDPATVEANRKHEEEKDPNKRAPTKQPKITLCTLECADNNNTNNKDESVLPFECTPAYSKKGKPVTKIVSKAGGHDSATPEFNLVSGGQYFFICDPFNRPTFRKTEED